MAGFAGALIPGSSARFDGPASIRIGLISTAIHYDLLLPLDATTRARFAFAAAAGVGVENPEAGWLIIGWGARDFYQSAGSYGDIPLSAVLKGITGDASVLRLESWTRQPLEGIPRTQILTLTPDGYSALIDHILAELGPVPQLVSAPGLTPHDAFFAATSAFNAFQTCNVWLGRALRAAGIPLGFWTPTPQSLRLSLRLHN